MNIEDQIRTIYATHPLIVKAADELARFRLQFADANEELQRQGLEDGETIVRLNDEIERLRAELEQTN